MRKATGDNEKGRTLADTALIHSGFAVGSEEPVRRARDHVNVAA